MIRKKFGKETHSALSFSDRVIAIARSIPPGKVTTYGHIARAAGGGNMASQSITTILGKAYNRGVTDIPFHRIVYANGRVWLDDTHRVARLKLYKKEGIHIDSRNRVVDFYEKLYLNEFN